MCRLDGKRFLLMHTSVFATRLTEGTGMEDCRHIYGKDRRAPQASLVAVGAIERSLNQSLGWGWKLGGLFVKDGHIDRFREDIHGGGG